MSNRQARREQARTSRAPRPTRPNPGTRKPSSSGSSGGGGSTIFSRGFLIAIGAFAIVGVIVVALVIMLSESDSEGLTANIEDGIAALPQELANGTKLGRDDAPIKIVQYEDFQCPFCLRYTANTEPGIIEDLVKPGKVQLEFRHLPILRNESFEAALASQCAADQNKFWPYSHELFLIQAKAGQTENEQLNVGRFSADKLKSIASDLGLDRTQFDSCYDGRTHQDLVTGHQREANQFGITGTPGFTINGQPLAGGAPSTLDGWKALIADFENQVATATANATLTPQTTASPSASASAAPAATQTPTATRTP